MEARGKVLMRWKLKRRMYSDKRLAERTCLQRSISEAQMQQEEQKGSHLKNKQTTSEEIKIR